MSDLPPIPHTVYSILGPISVMLVDSLKDENGEPAYGLWHADRRVIELCAGMHIAAAHQTLRHEWIHAVCDDAGVRIGGKRQERVCDAIASALVAEMHASQ